MPILEYRFTPKEAEVLLALANQGPRTGYEFFRSGWSDPFGEKSKPVMSRSNWNKIRKKFGPSALNLIEPWEIPNRNPRNRVFYWLTTLLDKKLAMHQGDKDMTLMRVSVEGRKKKGDKTTRIHQYVMVDRFDATSQTTSMARTTAFPCSTVGQMILEGKISEKGFIPPELAIKDERFDEFISKLELKGLSIKEREFLSDSN